MRDGNGPRALETRSPGPAPTSVVGELRATAIAARCSPSCAPLAGDLRWSPLAARRRPTLQRRSRRRPALRPNEPEKSRKNTLLPFGLGRVRSQRDHDLHGQSSGQGVREGFRPDTAQVAAAIDANNSRPDLDRSHQVMRRAAGGDVIEAACPPAIMNREARFYRALGGIRGYRSGRAAGLPR